MDAKHMKAMMLALIAALAGCGERSDPAAADVPGGDGDELVMVLTGEAPPYSFFNAKTGEYEGIEVDMARSAAAKLGRRLVLRKEKFENLLPMVKNGKADMAASGLAITEGRLKDVDFTDTVAVEGGMFLYRTGERVPTMITVETMRVGVVDSTTHDFYLTYHGVDPIRYRFCSDAVRDLLANRIDAVFYDKGSMVDEKERSGGRLAVTSLETRENFGIAVAKGASELMAALNEAIAERRAK